MPKRFFIVGVAAVVALLLAVSWWKTSVAPVNPKDTSSKQFVIASGDGVREISRKLKNENLIKNQIAFFILVKKLGIEKNIQAGSFQLSPSLSAYDIAIRLTRGTEDVWITIPEGWRSEEVLAYLQGQKIDAGKWTIETETKKWKMNEGKLFPDTYLIPKLASISAIRSLLRSTFDAKTSSLAVDSKTLILASLVEREAKTAADRPLVASVLLNRLNIGMKLDVDATVQYALGKSGNWWPKDLTLDDLKVNSPYNTYINSGLPPAPIANPGLSAISAVLNPAQTDYLYYVSDKEGHLHYASTLDEHNQNVAKYISQ